MMIFLIVLGLLFLVAVGVLVRDVARDGYRPIPTRPDGQEMLSRYR